MNWTVDDTLEAARRGFGITLGGTIYSLDFIDHTMFMATFNQQARAGDEFLEHALAEAMRRRMMR